MNADEILKAIDGMSPEDRQLAMFGVIERDGKIVPIIKKQHTGEAACKRCGGFGTGGNPLCGVIRTCDDCAGTGKRFRWWERLFRRKR